MNGQILTGLASRGHQIQALAPFEAEAYERMGGRAGMLDGVDVTPLFVPFAPTSIRLISAEYREFERREVESKLPGLIARGRPQVAFFGRESYAEYLPMVYSYGLPSALVTHFGASPTDALESKSSAYSQELGAHLREASAVVAVAAHQAEAWHRVGLRNVRLIRNSIDTELFSPTPKDRSLLRELRIDDDAAVVLHASNFKAEKRPGDLIRSAGVALQSHPRLVYIVVGEGNLRRETETMCEQLGLADRFRFVGWVNRETFPSYLSLADAVVMPSEIEALSLALLEAQACGKVVVASDIPGSREAIVHGETGLLFRLGDVDDMAKKTLLAASDPELRARIGRRARESVCARPLARVVDEYIELFEELAGRADANLA